MIDIKLGYDDIAIVPESRTTIRSRSMCNPFDSNMYLPIFASCMSSVVSMENINDFNNAGIHVVIPRSYPVDERIDYVLKASRGEHIYTNFVAFSLEEINHYFISQDVIGGRSLRKPLNVCIDLANGHMDVVINTVKLLKSIYGKNISIMTGNIANPETYIAYENAGLDYLRCSIGSGEACLTSSNLGVHYPVFSLLENIYEIKKKMNGKCKIVADGGIRGYRDIQKALIYADYVMIGGLFNKAIESSCKTTYGTFYWNVRGKKIPRPIKTLIHYGKEIPRNKYNKVMSLIKEGKLTVWKQFFGQSTKLAQTLINNANGIDSKTKTSEGLIKYQKVEYSISGWAENEADYLRSAMSYTNSRDLEEYKDSKWVMITKIDYNK